MTDDIVAHYSFGGLQERIEAGIARLQSPLTIEALGAVDEFHIGGRAATAHLVAQLELAAGQRVLDVGSGLGGTARYLATACDVDVTGVDLTEEYVQVATWLTELVGLEASVRFMHASAAELPASAHPFSAATMVHVGMNLADKPSVFVDIAERLAIGGRFAIYDLMVTGAAQPDYPVPWAATPSSSFLETPAQYITHLEAAGFTDIVVNDRTQAAVAAFDQIQQTSVAGPPPLGLHLVMGPETPTKLGNLVAAIRSGIIAPTEIIARRP